jgi:hypothetical protein
MFSAHFDFLHVRIDPLEAIAALGSADIGGTMAAASLIDGWIAEGKSWAGHRLRDDDLPFHARGSRRLRNLLI